MRGKELKYWDGSDETNIIETHSEICDLCERELEPFVGSCFMMPPDGIGVDEVFICSKCVRRQYLQDVSGWNLFGRVVEDIREEIGDDEFIKNLYELSREYLPKIFRLQRKPISKNLREQILKKYNFACQGCGTKDRLSIDHIKPYSKGGTDKESNLTVLCRSCNSKKGAKWQEKE